MFGCYHTQLKKSLRLFEFYPVKPPECAPLDTNNPPPTTPNDFNFSWINTWIVRSPTSKPARSVNNDRQTITRINDIKAGDYTRKGAAIRHLSIRLYQVDAGSGTTGIENIRYLSEIDDLRG